MTLLELSFASGEASLSVRRFAIEEAMSTLFGVSIWARSPNDDLDLDAIVGQPAAFRVDGSHGRRWAGICNHVELVEAEATGLSTYHLTIVPTLWLLTQRTNHRIFQRLSVPDMVDAILMDWSIEATWSIARGSYPRFEYRVQYGESDFDFMSRLLEEAGISFMFADQDEPGPSRLVFSDVPQRADPREGGPIRFSDKPSHGGAGDYVSHVQLVQEVRPSRVVQRDFDFRRPAFPLLGVTPTSKVSSESALELYQYSPGAFSALQAEAPAAAAAAPSSGEQGGNGIGAWVKDELKQARDGLVDAVDDKTTHFVEDEVTSALNKAVTGVAGKLAGGIASDILGGLSGGIAGDVAGQAANALLHGGRGGLHLDLEARIRDKVTEVVDKRIGGFVDDKVTGFVQKTVGAIAGKKVGEVAGGLLGDAVGGLAGKLSGGLAGKLTGGLAGKISGAFGGATKLVGDDRGAVRQDEKAGAALAMRQLESVRAARKAVTFGTNAFDLRPGTVFSIGGHPRSDLGSTSRLLSVGLTVEGTAEGEWSASGRAVFADVQYRPPLKTPKPVIHGMQSAIVVGPKGEEIHTDELGRVRVQFHWDRAAPLDDTSSLWVRVSQGWGGGGYGMMAIPRVGHEVLVAFLEGDPDHPVVAGRVYNGTAPVPHKLPDNKTVSSLRSASSPGGEGFNELSFEDAKGRELMFVHAERNLKKLVKHDETEVTQRNRHVTVGDNLTKLVMVDETETTGADRTLTVGGTLSETAGGDHKVTVGGSHSESVAKGMSLTVGPTPPPPGGGPAPKPPAPPAGVMKLEAKERLEIVVGAATLVIDKSGKVTLNGVEFEFTATGQVQINGSVIDLN